MISSSLFLQDLHKLSEKYSLSQQCSFTSFLYDGRKFDIRHYMMISTINGNLKADWYSQGYIRTRYFQSLHSPGNDTVQKYSKIMGNLSLAINCHSTHFKDHLITLTQISRDTFETFVLRSDAHFFLCFYYPLIQHYYFSDNFKENLRYNDECIARLVQDYSMLHIKGFLNYFLRFLSEKRKFFVNLLMSIPKCLSLTSAPQRMAAIR